MFLLLFSTSLFFLSFDLCCKIRPIYTWRCILLFILLFLGKCRSSSCFRIKHRFICLFLLFILIFLSLLLCLLFLFLFLIFWFSTSFSCRLCCWLWLFLLLLIVTCICFYVHSSKQCIKLCILLSFQLLLWFFLFLLFNRCRNKNGQSCLFIKMTQ